MKFQGKKINNKFTLIIYNEVKNNFKKAIYIFLFKLAIIHCKNNTNYIANFIYF